MFEQHDVKHLSMKHEVMWSQFQIHQRSYPAWRQIHERGGEYTFYYLLLSPGN